jgi:Tfp pilus assembly protein PilN
VSTLDIIAALIVAVHRNDTRATQRLLEQLEARLPPEEVIELLEAIAGETLPAPTLPVTACA